MFIPTPCYVFKAVIEQKTSVYLSLSLCVLFFECVCNSTNALRFIRKLIECGKTKQTKQQR